MDQPPWMPILMYHRIRARGGAPDDDPFEAPVELLELHLDWLAAHDFAPVPLDLALQDPAPGEGRRFAVTFDDGYRDFLEQALPVLADRGIPATVFVVSGAVGGHAQWGSKAPLVSGQDLRDIRAAGIFVGSHSRSHRRLAGLSAADLRAEVGDSKAELEDLLSAPVRHFAYPYHSLDEAAMAEVERAGYQAAAGGHEHAHQRFNLHRVDATSIRPKALGLYFRGLHRYGRTRPLPGIVRRLARVRG